MDNKKLTEKEIQEKINKVNGAMAQEGMPLTKELKQKLYNCIIGKSSTEKERQKVIEKYRGIYDNKYKYNYEWTADYCYKDTDVLINKLNITNDDDLYNAERELVSLRTYELNEKPLKGNFDFEYLKDIHK